MSIWEFNLPNKATQHDWAAVHRKKRCEWVRGVDIGLHLDLYC